MTLLVRPETHKILEHTVVNGNRLTNTGLAHKSSTYYKSLGGEATNADKCMNTSIGCCATLQTLSIGEVKQLILRLLVKKTFLPGSIFKEWKIYPSRYITSQHFLYWWIFWCKCSGFFIGFSPCAADWSNPLRPYYFHTVIITYMRHTHIYR